MADTRFRSIAPLLLLALLSILAYAPSLFLPLIEDDYPIITEARLYGSAAGFPALIDAPVFRARATSYWTIDALWQAFHFAPPAFHAASLVLHIVNTWLVYGIALAWPPMRPAALGAAMFFAVHEGHQEAVIWFTAINELLQFLFGMGALWCWMSAESRKRPWPWRVAGVLLFALAMVSKESAVILPAFFLLVTPPAQWRRALPRLAPYLVLALVTAASIAAASGSSFRFSDGSFSVHAPFWITWSRGIARLLWFWGFFALAVILFRTKAPALMNSALLALAWIGVAFLPYSFLEYSTQIPSRQTYLASAGLVLLFGLALTAVPRKLAAVLLVAMVAHNVGYLWTKKRSQFLQRAEPTEQLIRLARETNGAIWVRCFPRNRYIAEEAVHVGAGRPPSDLIWSETEAAQRKPAATFCYEGH